MTFIAADPSFIDLVSANSVAAFTGARTEVKMLDEGPRCDVQTAASYQAYPGSSSPACIGLEPMWSKKPALTLLCKP